MNDFTTAADEISRHTHSPERTGWKATAAIPDALNRFLYCLYISMTTKVFAPIGMFGCYVAITVRFYVTIQVPHKRFNTKYISMDFPDLPGRRLISRGRNRSISTFSTTRSTFTYVQIIDLYCRCPR